MEMCDFSLLGNVSRFAFHNLTSHCDGDAISHILPFPSTFFIQLVRFSLCICVIVLLLSLYNHISVMHRHLLSTASCCLYWVAMCTMLALKSMVMMIFPVVAWKATSSNNVTSYSVTSSNSSLDLQPATPLSSVGDLNMAGFILQAVLQCAAILLLFFALDHEHRFRSSHFASVEKPSRYCVALSLRCNVLCSWLRLLALALSLLPLVLMVAVEVVYHYTEFPPSPLLWVYIASLPLARLACLVLGVVLACKRGDRLTPTVAGKVYLLIGLLLSLMEDFPNFVTTCNSTTPCQLQHLSVFDLLQLVGIASLPLFVLFVRSQYLRVEQESKLNLVWDLQKLLQVNGRKDIIRHYT